MMQETIRERLESLAGEIETHAPELAERMRNLGAAVEGGQSAGTWANSDVFALIDPDLAAEQLSRQGAGGRWVRVLELLRNALVFVPIAVTWFGIWHALEMYSAAFAADPTIAELGFLFLWQNGFEGRTWITLSIIALIDGIILSIVFLLTLAVLWSNNRQELEESEARQEVADVLADAALVLNGRQTQQTTTFIYQFEQMAQGLLKELGYERKRIDELAGRKEKEVQDLALFVQDFRASTEGLVTAMQAVQHVPQQLQQSIGDLTAAFRQLTEQHKQHQQAFTTTTQQAATHLGTLTDTYRTMSGDMQAVGRKLQMVGDEVQEMGSDLRDAIHVSNTMAMQNAQAIADMHATARNLGTAQTQFLDALAHERQALATGTQGMQAAVQALQQSYATVEQKLSALSDVLHAMATQQQQFVDTTQQTASEFKHLTEAQQTIGINMQTMGINLQTMVVELRTAIEGLQRTVQGAGAVGPKTAPLPRDDDQPRGN